jgi:L-asparaginase
MHRMKIAAIFTGGTIGSLVSPESVDLDADPPRRVLESWQGSHPGAQVEFVVSDPLRLLSEDANPGHWERLARHIRRRIDARADAVIVLHGSDTLPWTACALAFAFQGIPIPIVLVAADLPLDNPASNGQANFDAAMAFVRDEGLPGVFVVWTNPGEPPTVHLGTRLEPADPFDDRFRSILGKSFGHFEEGRFVRNSQPGNPSREEVSRGHDAMVWTASCRRLESSPSLFARRLLVLPCHPGLDTGRISLDSGWQGILQLPFHSGTASSLEGEASVLDLARRARDHGIPFVLGPTRSRAVPYASTTRLLEAGAKLLPPMSLPAAQVKLMLLLGTQGHLAGYDASLAFEQV